MDEGASALGTFVLIGVLWIVPIFVATNVWTRKGGGGGAGLLMGLCLGWIGVLIAALATPSRAPQFQAGQPSATRPMRECPFCKSEIRADASVCSHCQRESSAWVLKDGRWWSRSSSGQWYVLNPANPPGSQWEKPDAIPQDLH